MLRAGSAQQGLPVRLRMLGLDVDGDSRPRLFRGDPSVAENLDRLVSSNADSLEGLMVNLAERPGGVLLLDIPVGNMEVELCEVHVSNRLSAGFRASLSWLSTLSARQTGGTGDW